MCSWIVTSRYQQLESEAGLCFSEATLLYGDLKELGQSLENYSQMSGNLEIAFLKYWFEKETGNVCLDHHPVEGK